MLADGYPTNTVKLAPEFFASAARKKLRLYVEFPATLPDMEPGKPQRAPLERAVVASDVFGSALPKLRLLVIHDCHFVEASADNPYLVLAKVAGYDTAVFGLQDAKAHPILFEHPRGGLLVATTKLSQFVTARYAPKEAWQEVWKKVLGWLRPQSVVPELDWTHTVRPTYVRDAHLPAHAVREAVIRGINWHRRAGMLMHPAWKNNYTELRKQGVVNPQNPVGPAPDPKWPAGDGSTGLLEGVSSQVHYDGSQPIRWWLRTDSIGESSLAFALRSKMDGDQRSAEIAENLLNWVYFDSKLFHNDPNKANYGLLDWAPDSTVHYGDNDIRVILGCMGTSAVLASDRWDGVLCQTILGNFRTTGSLGFRGGALDDGHLLRVGWEHYWRTPTIHLAPHYEAWIWASYLWLYDKTKNPLLLERTRNAIGRMMAAYPDNWKWTNGIQQERGRMLLALAWLIRVDDLPMHRAWLKRIADDMLKCQDACGAIREELGELSRGGYRPPQSNAEYGKHEAAAIQQNGDPMADLLYTCNFTFLGLHEAYAATGDPQYQRMADKLADFLVRIQIRSEAHPELDGGWFRSFDYQKWDYWGSNADVGWGAWSIECGWTQGWITSVLALRQLKTSLWDLTAHSHVGRHFGTLRSQMIPDVALAPRPGEKVRHAAVGKAVTLRTQFSGSYPGNGAASLTDGLLARTDHRDAAWLGFLEADLVATIDLGEPVPLSELSGSFLQDVPLGIFLPRRVEFLAGNDPAALQLMGIAQPVATEKQPGPLKEVLTIKNLQQRARYVEVRAANIQSLPPWHQAAGQKAWLFVDEVFVNLKEE